MPESASLSEPETSPNHNWFTALGNPIPDDQREAAAEEATKMGLETSADSDWVHTVAEYVEHDFPEKAINTTQEHLDLTGTIRFLAVLCTPQELISQYTDE